MYVIVIVVNLICIGDINIMVVGGLDFIFLV